MEPGKSRTLGGVVKPKFTPKAQVRAPPAPKPPPSNTNENSRPPPPPTNSGRGAGRGRGRGGANDGRGGRGRGGRVHVFTGGATFFSGGAPSASNTFQSNMSIGRTADVAMVKSELESMHVAGGSSSSSSSGAVTVKEESERGTSPAVLDDEDDEDARIRRQLALGTDGGVGTSYNPLSPVVLPLRPQSPEVALPFAACSQATDTPEQQAARRAAEETDDMFLIQLPSTLLPPLAGAASSTETGTGVGANGDDDAHSLYEPNEITRLTTGHVGKLQIMKSGKVFLVLDAKPGETPLRHQINLGVRSTFAQTLVAVAPGQQPPAGSPPEAACDNMYVLGEITKKLVITPVFGV